MLPILFESIGDEPTPANLRNLDMDTSFAVHSPSLDQVIGPRNWSGYFGSPRHFTTRVSEFLRGRGGVAALEIMNEPGLPSEAPNRHDSVVDMLRAARDTDPGLLLTMGSRKASHNAPYTDPPLDIYQYHDNLPVSADAFLDRAEEARDMADAVDVPMWCTEWQRVRAEPPSRWQPFYQNLAPVVNDALADGTLDGAFFWGLMLKPAYIEGVRLRGRYNGVVHEDGSVFSLADAEAIAGERLALPERHELTAAMLDSRFPFPRPDAPEQDCGTAVVAWVGIAAGILTILRKRPYDR